MKRTEQILIYDRSFNGFLSAVYLAFKQNLDVADFSNRPDTQVGLFSDNTEVETNVLHAKRVWEGLQKKNYTALKNIYFAFLSETVGIEKILYQYIRFIMLNKSTSDSYDHNRTISKIDQLAALVGREKQRVESSIQFHSTMDEVRIAYIEPSFNVLPLVSKHFRSKYRKYSWVIFDLQRQYGLFYNGTSVEIISSGFLQRLRNHRLQAFEGEKQQKNKTDTLLQGSGYRLKDRAAEVNAYSAA